MEPAKKKRRQGDSAAGQILHKYETTTLESGQIRKLELLPAPSVSGSLYTNLFVDHPGGKPYEALSYTWESDARPLTLNIGSAVLPIGKNLDAALRQFRLPDSSRWLWVDALCINQDDHSERTAQVAMMTEIYRCAETTLGWLGLDSSERDGEAAIAFFLWLSRSPRAQNQLQRRKNPLALQKAFEVYNSQAKEKCEITQEKLLQFCQRRYFKRRWILQEVGVARESQFWCGDNSIDGFDLADAASYLLFESSPVPITTPFMRFMSLRKPERYHASGKKRAAREIEDKGNEEPTENEALRALGALERFREFECFDGRDRIASLAWIDGRSRLFSVEYEQSTEDLYVGFAETALRISSDCLACVMSSAARRRHAANPKLPSWTPDWRVISEENNARLRRLASRSRNRKSVRLLQQSETSTFQANLNGASLQLSLEAFRESQAVVLGSQPIYLQPGDTVLALLENSSLRFELAGKLRAIILREDVAESHHWRIMGALDLEITGSNASLVDHDFVII